ncbi:MAG: hypothetical protein ACON4P_08415 [Candidatus Puniceispirillales bacterium]
MIPTPPGLGAIVAGLTYALQLSIRRTEPQSMAPDSRAIWDALWFRYMLTLLNGGLILGLSNGGAVAMLAVLGLVDTLSYPVVSQIVIRQMRLDRFFPQFILAVTWVGNLRVMILMMVILFLGQMDMATASIYMFPFAIWMIWATWSAATRSVENKGWVGAGMVVLMMLLEMVNGMLIISFLHPLLVQG